MKAQTVTALVMVVNGLRVTSEYVYKSVCVCVCVCVSSICCGHPWLSNHVHLVNGDKWSSLSLQGLANVRSTTAQYLKEH